MKNMKIRIRMLLSYLILIGLTIIISVVAVLMLRQVGSNLNTFYDKQFQTVNYAWSARRSVYAAESSMLRALVDTDSTNIQSFLKTAEDEALALSDAIASARKTFEGDVALLDTVEQFLEQAKSIRLKIVKQIESGQTARPIEV